MNKDRVSRNLAGEIVRNAFTTPEKDWLVKINNAQVMTEGINHSTELPKIGEIVDLSWIKEADDQAEYELNKNELSTDGEVIKVEDLVKFYLVTVELLPKK